MPFFKADFMTERRRLLLLAGFFVGIGLISFGISYLLIGSAAAAIMPSVKAAGIGGLAGVACHLTRSNLTFAGAVFAMALLWFLAPYIVPVR
jgi:hypothetical protein